MPHNAPVTVVLHAPTTEGGKQALAQRVSQAHAGFVLRALERLPCPARQKPDLLRAVMDAAQKRNQPKGSDL